MAIGKREDSEPVRITTAATSRREEMDGRVRGYLISMGLRVLCFVGAVAVGPGWLRWVLMAGAVFLPYVAVVMANAARSSHEEPLLTGVTARQLEGGSTTLSVEAPTTDSPRSET
ncbi:DUF3099 domain-containing protein [Nocardioides gilvus]|uniref:DUF3099 domain-containing protein n=1 Tax=Nocardioides gilvus TaxID=1735589 RepID=UPI000D742FC7|nr:DUF3099 domain-containing protein [Nocardioides gilvus]